MKEKDIKALKEEFGIHFKNSSGELKFAISFIEDLLAQQREEIRRIIDREIEIAKALHDKEHEWQFQASVDKLKQILLRALKELD